ncbi:MAG: hypothetical protein COT91_00380 [Candidatus Doudnabacteria bacterium CG10_big_fil_rev_8_21_14_0_10_41_10]|uniref:Methyltransferase type 11 domain-containing protein n=1 Tax=Candidatus Doudnabacteria bacterium CG10_big_fil_rev_8_21_14_0_10_41_10 TaxID=1974551 RepID=A0A2H0VEP2_9BACT|nr:MAG: hypothetical protein COT91_00380 [Candidatus Doudnabacteria bacterium CG10_big_fil_rev_8_21_14_0_10_41_10]
MDSRLAKEQEIQDFVSDFYEGVRFTLPYSRRYQLWFFKQLVNLVKPEGLILDNGCGSGHLGEVLRDKKIIGLDLSEKMLKYATKRLTEVHQGSAESLPFNNSHFDTIFCRSLLHHLQNPEVAVKEVARVLKPGGKVIFADTLKNIVTSIPREMMRKKSEHFSETHQNFSKSEMLNLVGKDLEIVDVRYMGYLAYTFFGFPDVINFQKYIPFKSIVYPTCLAIDKILSRIPILRRLGANIVVVAKKV